MQSTGSAAHPMKVWGRVSCMEWAVSRRLRTTSADTPHTGMV
jgi:hypothetical protein